LLHEYIFQRQTVRQLAKKHGKSRNWIRNELKQTQTTRSEIAPQPVVVIADVTFFGRSFGICVFRSPSMRKNLYFREVQHESNEVYLHGKNVLEASGFTIKAIVLDGRPGVRQLFSHIPVQMCHFHQKQIITRYLTNNPKLEAGRELKLLTTTLCKTNEKDFTDVLDAWYGKWSSFLQEKTIDPFTRRWHYTHKRLRSAHRSLRVNLPYLFTYQKYPDLNIPNTTNSLDGSFSRLKELVNIHRGLKKEMKDKIIGEILGK